MDSPRTGFGRSAAGASYQSALLLGSLAMLSKQRNLTWAKVSGALALLALAGLWLSSRGPEAAGQVAEPKARILLGAPEQSTASPSLPKVQATDTPGGPSLAWLNESG